MAVEIGIQEDKSVSRLEAMAKEVEDLRGELSQARERVVFLEERIAATHEHIFKPEPVIASRR